MIWRFYNSYSAIFVTHEILEIGVGFHFSTIKCTSLLCEKCLYHEFLIELQIKENKQNLHIFRSGR